MSANSCQVSLQDDPNAAQSFAIEDIKDGNGRTKVEDYPSDRDDAAGLITEAGTRTAMTAPATATVHPQALEAPPPKKRCNICGWRAIAEF